MKIKNTTGTTKTWCGLEITAGSAYVLQPGEAVHWAEDDTFVAAIFSGEAQVLDMNDAPILPALSALTALQGIVKTVDISSTPPFAEPSFRTKLDAVPAPVTIQPGAQGNVDYQMPAERWAFGGGGLVVGAEPGDWIEAMVVDTLGLIPEAYRAALCEAVPGWPVVNTYVVKQWIIAPVGGQNASFNVNTYPLIAKVTPGLTLRTIYHATNAGGPRTVYANLSLTIKL